MYSSTLPKGHTILFLHLKTIAFSMKYMLNFIQLVLCDSAINLCLKDPNRKPITQVWKYKYGIMMLC